MSQPHPKLQEIANIILELTRYEVSDETALLTARKIVTALREPTNDMGAAATVVEVNKNLLFNDNVDSRRLTLEQLDSIGFFDCLSANPEKWFMPNYRTMIDKILGENK